ncbi:MAG TPA: hypothetical protein VFE33_10875 [Thermoanaerobaculia bacterium]|nr:hypothetical protein [Thermoanaerobaculia bacterium]
MSSPSGRATRVHRLVRRPGLDLAVRRRSWWEGFSAADTSFVVGMLASLLLLPIEIPLWTGKPLPLPAWLRFSPFRGLAAGVALLATGEFVDRLLRSHTGRTAPPRRWRVLLGLLARLPLISFYAPSLWRHVIQSELRKPAKATLNLHRQGTVIAGARFSRAERLGFAFLPFLWVGSVIVVPILGAAWLGAAVENRAWSGLAWGVAALLHLAAAAAVRHNLRQEGRRGQVTDLREAVLEVLPWLFLVPLPGSSLALAASAFPALQPSTALVTSVYWRRYNASRLPAWRDLEAELGRTWQAAPAWKRWLRPGGLARPAKAGRAEKEIRALERWRALLLCGEGTALGWGLVALGHRAPALASTVESAWRLLAWTSVTLGVLGLAGQGILFAARLLRATSWIDRLEDRPYGRLLLTSQAGFLTGFYTGRLSGEGLGKEATLWLALAGALAATLGVFRLLVNLSLPSGRLVREESAEVVIVPLAILGLLGLEVATLRLGGLHRLLHALQVFALLSLLAAPVLGLALGAPLLRPYIWSDLFSPGLERHTRRHLAVLALTLVLPLGGLAMPYWAFARHGPPSQQTP